MPKLNAIQIIIGVFKLELNCRIKLFLCEKLLTKQLKRPDEICSPDTFDLLDAI